MYSLVALNVTKATKTLNTLDASNISTFLKSQHDVQKRTFYLFGDHCQHVQFDPELSEGIEFDSIMFSKETQAFWFDSYGTMQKIEFAPLPQDHSTVDVCLKFELYANRSTSPLVIQSDKFYYHSYFDKPQMFNTIQEAKEAIKRKDINPDNLRLYR